MQNRETRSSRSGLGSHVLGLGLIAIVGLLVFAGTASAAGPEWRVATSSNADYFLSGQKLGVYKLEAENVGSAPTTGAITLKHVIPAGLTAKAVHFYLLAPNSSPPAIEYFLQGNNLGEFVCASNTECSYPGVLTEFGITSLKPGQKLLMFVLVEVPANVEGSLKDIGKVSGGGAPAAEASTTNAAAAVPPPGTLHFDASVSGAGGEPYTQAGGHPFKLTTEFSFETFSFVSGTEGGWDTSGTAPVPDPKDVVVDLPPGLVANPQGVPRCKLSDYFTQECEQNKVAVGNAGIRLFGWSEGAFRAMLPVYNLEPSGDFPGQLGLTIAGLPVIMITTGVRDGSNYGVAATSLAAQSDLTRIRLNLWGVPADEGHNINRGEQCFPGKIGGNDFYTQAEDERACNEGASIQAEVPPTPFITMPTECSGNPLSIVGSYDSWQHPGEFAQGTVELDPVDGCNNLQFHPSIEAQPTTTLADAPSGLKVHLHVPQNEEPEGVATPELKEAVVKLPKGLSLDPPAAGGLVGCTEAQIGLHTEAPANCPDASKLGTAVVRSSLLNHVLEGSVYLATPYNNPSGSLLAGYISVAGQGIRIKLPGRFETDPATGQITGRFAENPQLPFEDLTLSFFEGARGVFRTPAVCGKYETTSELTPFSAPESGPPATPSANFETTTPENGGTCPSSPGEMPHAPRFRAGTEASQAGIFSPFSLRLAREDGSQEVTGIETTLPPGILARLAGIPYCSDSAIEAARATTGSSQGESPSCPATSEVGVVDVGAGAGPTPLNVSGRVYLAGPYNGAPLSLAVITPAVAGPFDLGTVVTRVALQVNPSTTQIHAVSDPIPNILKGIPLDIRTITFKLSRPNFTVNPTNCDELSFSGSALSVLNVLAPLSQRFQLGDCGALRFKPKLTLNVSGGINRRGHPALTAVVQMPTGNANIARTSVALPPTEILDNGHINNPCTRVEFAANACPATSVMGVARAETPLLDKGLEGPVYLMSNGHDLPDLIVDLHGQIHVILDAQIDTNKQGGLRATFENVPDAPISKFVLTLQGGKKGLIQNSVSLCGKPQRASAVFTAQDAEAVELNPALRAKCKGHHTKHKSHGSRRTSAR